MKKRMTKKMVEKRRKILLLMESFLEERREVGKSGWAEVTPDDLAMLDNVLTALIEAKCAPDADGDRPIEFRLIDRTREMLPPFQPMPYRRDVGEERFLEHAQFNLSVAYSQFDTAYQIFRSHRLDAQKDARIVGPDGQRRKA